MITVTNRKVRPYDVDSTLVKWHPKTLDNCIQVEQAYGFGLSSVTVKPIQVIIDDLKKYKAEGYYIVLWSAGGWEWAKAVAEALQLTEYIDLVIEKPVQYVDDLRSDFWMDRQYPISQEDYDAL